jgi:hypothetical protein
MRTVFMVAAGILILTSVQCRAESYADSLYNLAVAAYDTGNYVAARFEAQAALWNRSKLNVIQTCKFLELLGSSFVALERWEDADSAFWDILELDKKWPLQLHLYPPPKIEQIFEDIRSQYLASLQRSDAERLPQEQLRFNASWRSLALPGWGQYYKGQKARGAVVASLQILSLATLVILQAEVNRRHNVYEDREGNEAITAYDEYTRVWRARNVVGYVALGIYVGAYLDALYTSVRR